MLFNRFSIVPELSSAARIPFPGATNALAMVSKFSVFIGFYDLAVEVNVDHIFSFSESLQRILTTSMPSNLSMADREFSLESLWR